MENGKYVSLIIEGLRDLPEDALAEIAGFVWFTRKRVLHPEAFEDELYALQIRADLKQMYQQEVEHLEEETQTRGMCNEADLRG
ncbi:MAG: hypothetical protein NZM28_00665 [Fimbriimonadales bacterium]|nr:hypothetical protein [Fimbriimonadales bacterium]